MRNLQMPTIRPFLAYLIITLLLIAADFLCDNITLPVQIDRLANGTFLHVGSQTISLGQIGTPLALWFDPHNPLIHEYQIDGTDYTNNNTLDIAYLQQISASPIYGLYAGMRDLKGLSHWRNLHIWTNQTTSQFETPSDQMVFPLPRTTPLHISLQLQRPEIPTTLIILTTQGDTINITINRNNRTILVTRERPGAATRTLTSTFFPVDVAPFAAMILDTLIRTTLWAEFLLLFVLVLETVFVALRMVGVSFAQSRFTIHWPAIIAAARRWQRAVSSRLHHVFEPLTDALHPVALLALVISFFFVSWIAVVQYHGEPHIYDASAYLFAAKMYAQGHLWVPVPSARHNFPGPFMLQYDGRWFSQYAPGTSLTLIPGIWLGAPWLVEPVLGTLALLGIGLIAARLYDRRVATLAVLLGALSPFYSYLAASYLSHAIALFYLVWGLWALLRFAQRASWWNLPVAALFFGMAELTREVSLLFAALVLAGVTLLCWKQIRQEWRRWLVPSGIFLLIVLIFISLNLNFNLLLTGNPLITPRLIFLPGDHWGFGEGVGFYGQHTLAAGLVNLDEQLTILAIDLFGWPFYCTLAFLLIPFLTRRAILSDWFSLVCFLALTGIWIGYYYHGIYLGPRYLFETLPFLLFLNARGILTMFEITRNWATWLQKRYIAFTAEKSLIFYNRINSGISTVALLILLMAYNLGYFLPRQIAVYTNYTGLPAGTRLDLNAIYHPPFHRAIIITSNYAVYQMVLFPLNDPLLHNNVLYAFTDSYGDLKNLSEAYPGRTLYLLEIAANGSVTYVPFSPL